MSSVGKVQIVQSQVDINQLHAESNALRENTIRQTTVTPSRDGEKLRFRAQKEKEQRKKREEVAEPTEKEEEGEAPPRRIDITV
jgi:hypothetical protein